MNIQEQIAAFEARKKTLLDANTAIMEKAAEEGTTLDQEQSDTFDENEADIAEIDKHLGRLKAMEKAMIAKAVPAAGGNAAEASASRGGSIHRASSSRGWSSATAWPGAISSALNATRRLVTARTAMRSVR